MATKKQKREAGRRRHEEFMQAEKEHGLKAQRMDRQRRAFKEREEWRENHEKRHSWKKRIKECPLCQDEIKAARQAEREAQTQGVS